MEDKYHIPIDIQKIISILTTIKSTIDANTDVTYTGFATPVELENTLTDEIEKLRSANYGNLLEIGSFFAPTATFQELSMANGWSEEYLKLARKFDISYENFNSKK